ncbi:hypothetical protein SEA_GRETCHEN_72 [Microbacterium phage Gretchen]|uniref:Uncharacterized protein n=1 Tax=Microbacterium phage Percival TaxID=2201439 RepID=A0A2Z4Q7I6_9CAUD|nr:hypothetical protein PBI_PERCIVAL_73 [Microbacterium phage Percival]UDL14846.1 hypothetical protein SEA_GRETCHEN_72 [Microbacterium phage Gretchen]
MTATFRRFVVDSDGVVAVRVYTIITAPHESVWAVLILP